MALAVGRCSQAGAPTTPNQHRDLGRQRSQQHRRHGAASARTAFLDIEHALAVLALAGSRRRAVSALSIRARPLERSDLVDGWQRFPGHLDPPFGALRRRRVLVRAMNELD
jgi:hypothetical protein